MTLQNLMLQKKNFTFQSKKVRLTSFRLRRMCKFRWLPNESNNWSGRIIGPSISKTLHETTFEKMEIKLQRNVNKCIISKKEQTIFTFKQKAHRISRAYWMHQVRKLCGCRRLNIMRNEIYYLPIKFYIFKNYIYF